MKYPEPGSTFIPVASGQVIDPLTMDQEQSDAIFGKPLMDALRERAKNPRPVMKYVQIVPRKESE